MVNLGSEVNSIGWEIEFPIIKKGVFVSWNPDLRKFHDMFAKQFKGSNLYEDATPCAEYASAVNDNYMDLLEESREVFKQMMEKIPNAIFFSGGIPRHRSTFAGHIQIGNKRGLTNKRIYEVCRTLQGSQSFMELMSQNFKSGRNADERAVRRDYFHFYTPGKSYKTERTYDCYTWNEHQTVENRIPPSTGFYHMLTLAVLEKAWLALYKGKLTMDMPDNWKQATIKGPNGVYYIATPDELFKVDYTTYVNFFLNKLEPFIKEETKTLSPDARSKVDKYIDVLRRTPLSNIMAGKSIMEAKKMAKEMVFKGKSFVDDVKIASIKIPKGAFGATNVANVISSINKSKERKEFQRFRNFIMAVSRKDASLANPEDIEIIHRIIAKKKLKEVI